jgi:hypothetical protein
MLRSLVRKPEGRRPCETLELTWDCHIKVHLKRKNIKYELAQEGTSGRLVLLW